MLTLLGLILLWGAVVSLIPMRIRGGQGRHGKRLTTTLAGCIVLFVAVFITVPSSHADTPTPAPTEAPVLTEIPTAESGQTVAPVSDEQLDEGYLDAWFDDSLMIGDSIAEGLNRYVAKERNDGHPCLGSMRIVGTSGFTLKIALAAEKKETHGQVLFRSNGRTISDMVELTGAKSLFLMIGVRDIEYYSAEKMIEVYDELISIIKANHPDLRIYIHSFMPTLKSFAKSVNVTSEMNKAANVLLRAFCEEKGYTYLELADLVRDEEGYLKWEYSWKDYSFHPNDLARAIWVRLLRSCARDEYYAGIWKLEETAND